MKKIFLFLIISVLVGCKTSPNEPVLAKWITANVEGVNAPNRWIAFRKGITLKEVPKEAFTKIAVDSKYWLWINGELAVFEGGLKRGPNPTDTYYDELNLAPFLKEGENQISILMWYFGKEGFSHKDSGKAGLIFDMDVDGKHYVSDASWMSRVHPAYENTGEPLPNFRLPESNIRFNAEKDIVGWQSSNDFEKYDFKTSVEIGGWGDAPWNALVKRPIPFWKDFGIKSASFTKEEKDGKIVYTASLPYNMQMTPILDVSDTKGGNMIEIETDHLYGGSDTNLRAEYITKSGDQEYESIGWLNGQKIIIKCPKEVVVNNIKYRETGYDAQVDGSFSCDNEFYMKFWEKGLRTLYINMRDTYYDCPDRERAQWWGDVVVLMGESFYTYSTSAHALMRKAILELVDWQREDGTLFSPIPAGNYSKELPAQMLASIGEYGFWNYYMNTGDEEILARVYPSVKRYLGVWKLDDTGLTEYRAGDWSWGDWGDNIDERLILAGWHYIALNSTAKMADILGHKEEAKEYRSLMKKIKDAYNKCWDGKCYRHPSYEKDTDDRVHAMAVISGIAEPEKYSQLFEVFKTQWHASPYMEKYVMEALFQMGYGEYALQRVEKRFGLMVNSKDYTTLFEGWEVGGFGGGTTNHAWSGGALTVISQYLCGIAPMKAGYDLFKIEPDPASFNSASISVPTVKGLIKSEFMKDGNTFTLNVSIPDGTEALVYLPKDYKEQVLINNQSPNEKQNIVDTKYKKADKQGFLLKSGEYTLQAKSIK